MKKLFVCVLAGMCMLAATGFAGIEGGEREIGGSFNIMKPKDVDAMWFAVATLGYFMNPQVRVALVASVNGFSGETGGFVGGGVDYFFNNGSEVIPYGGIGVIKDVGEDASSDIQFDVHGGFKQFISEKTSLNYQVQYYATSEEPSDGVMTASVGFSIYL
jgi:hypothetical protein